MDKFIDGLLLTILGICAASMLAILVAFPFAMHSAIKHDNEFFRECEAKGGVPMSIRNTGLRCFAKDAVL